MTPAAAALVVVSVVVARVAMRAASCAATAPSAGTHGRMRRRCHLGVAAMAVAWQQHRWRLRRVDITARPYTATIARAAVPALATTTTTTCPTTAGPSTSPQRRVSTCVATPTRQPQLRPPRSKAAETLKVECSGQSPAELHSGAGSVSGAVLLSDPRRMGCSDSVARGAGSRRRPPP